MIEAIEDLAQTLSVEQACEIYDFPRSSYYRLRQASTQMPTIGAASPRPSPVRTLSAKERVEVRDVLNSERFQDCSPRQVYATLLDENVYHCSVSTMYRVLREHNEVRERRQQVQHPVYTKPELLATAPNQVWSWDITKLRGPSKWLYYYLYVLIDIYSRYVVGWLLAEREDAELAQQLIQESCQKQQIGRGQLTVHSDNGPAMIAHSLAQLLNDLDVNKTHSRPYTANDNPFSEAQFKTMKYRPDYPDRFGCLQDARLWASQFFDWYNNDHYHTGIALLTPATVHHGLSTERLAQRQTTLDLAYARHPERFVQGVPKPESLPDSVWINPPTVTQPAQSTGSDDSLTSIVDTATVAPALPPRSG